MKGETCGVLVKSFEGLRARMYTFTIEVDYESKRKTKKVLMNIIKQNVSIKVLLVV